MRGMRNGCTFSLPSIAKQQNSAVAHLLRGVAAIDDKFSTGYIARLV